MSRKFLSPVNLTHGSTLPASGNLGDLFYKSDELKIYVYDGISWVIAQGAASGGGGVTVSATAPAEPAEGDYWFDSNTAKSFIFYDGYWVEVGYSSSGFMVSATAPVSPSEGDAWLNTSTNFLNVYYGSAWVEVGTASPTFTGTATFDDIVLTDDASIIGTVTVRDDMVLTGETLTLGEVTNVASSVTPTAFLANDFANGYYAASCNGGTHLNVDFSSTAFRSALSVGGTIIMDGTARTIVSFTAAYYPTEIVLSSAYSNTSIQSITLDVTSTTITTDSTSLDSDVAAIATSHVAIGASNVSVSTATITSSSISFAGASSAQAGDIVTMRSSDLSKISGIRYDGVPSSITYSATDGLWTIPGIPVREVTGYSLAIGQDSALNTLGANQSAMLGHQAGAYTEYIFGSVLSGYRAGASAVNNIQYSVGIGTSALEGANSSNANVAIGQNSSINLNGSYNTALGTTSLGFATSSDSVAVGSAALADSEGSYNVAIGSGAGQGVFGSNNVFIGYGVYSNGDSQLQIGNANVSAAPLIDGSFTDKKLSINGSLKFTEAAREKVYTTSTGFAGYTYYTQTNGAIQYITANATANGTVNIRPSSSLTMNNWLAVGESVTLVLQVTNGSTAYYPNAWQIDGSAVTPKWLGGTAPTGGNANAIDTYSLTITKTASATYTVFGSVSKFA